MEQKFKNYKAKQEYYRNLSNKPTTIHVSNYLVRNKIGKVIGVTKGITYRKNKEKKNEI